MTTFKLSITSPYGKAFDGSCEMLVVPGREGELGIMAGHAPMIAMLRRGATKVTVGGQPKFFVTGDGVCEVSRDEVNVLVDTAIKTADLAEAKTELAKHVEAIGEKK